MHYGSVRVVDHDFDENRPEWHSASGMEPEMNIPEFQFLNVWNGEMLAQILKVECASRESGKRVLRFPCSNSPNKRY